MIDKSQNTVNRFQCLEKWQQFGGSCYYLSNITSTVIEANDTCNMAYSNNSQLMQIRHSIELYYAAHFLITNNLPELLIGISSHVLNEKKFLEGVTSSDHKKWQMAENKFRKIRLKYSKKQVKKVDQPRHETTLYDDVEINHIDDLNDDSEQLDNILKVCDQFVWNVLEEDPQLFLLTRYLVSNKFICSISDIDLSIRYKYMCQYVLDFCFDNSVCGKHGRCINGLVGFKCACYFWSDGLLCREISMKFIQIAIGLFMMLLLIVLTQQPIQQYQQRIMKKLFDPCKTSSTVSDSIQDVTSKFMTDERSEATSALESEKQERNHIRFVFQRSDVRTGQSGDCLSPIEPFETTNRYETASLCGIIMVEILMALEHFFIDLSELWDYGVLRLLFERFLLPFLYSIRYYPIFASLQQKNTYVRFFAFLYMTGIIGYTIIRRSLCMDYLPLSKRFSIYDEVKHRMELGTWITIYGVLKNMPQFYLLSYISAEITIRFIYDPIYLNHMKKTGVKKQPITPDIESDMHKSTDLSPKFPNRDNNSSTYCSHIRKFVSKIYQWNSDFQFTTIAMCAYTLAFVLLFYLTCVFTFQSIMGTSSMDLLIFCLKQIIDIDAEFMAYVSYLHVEKTYRTQSRSSAQEANILVSCNDPNRSETENLKKKIRWEYSSGEDSGEEESFYEAVSGAEQDIQSDISSISSKYLKYEHVEIPEDSTLPISNDVQQVPYGSQQPLLKLSTKKQVDEEKRTCELRNQNDISISRERQPLIPSKSRNDEEDQIHSLELSVCNDKKTAEQTRDDHIKSTSV
ncbi:unnamed protein product [Adineta steineri]|uniref:EGF-like domain-containing protein n=1 Tax=Adineta steineri TaxID=433720 RepID=A0A813W2J0_9BILA|nr:unnamed protein product [Adineta steineri]